MNREYYDKIADLMLYCISFKEGDKLTISLDYECREAAKHLAARAYQEGAAYVDLNYRDDFLHAEAIRAGKSEIEFPDYLSKKLDEQCGPGWKTAAFMSGADGDIYAGLPGEISASYFKCVQKLAERRQKAILGNHFPWTLTYLPSKEASAKVFPDLPVDEAVAAYWQQIIKIMRLDLDDPIAFWKEKFRVDNERKLHMAALGAESLHFKGPGTDLLVGLNPDAGWGGGSRPALTGEEFSANIPTDEIYTSPDYRKTEGRVTLTRPFVMHQNLGEVPVNAWFEFRGGKVVDYGAEKGKDSLDNLFARDERAKYLGEVALVDPHSPFAEAGLIFYNGLYDENAACHLALGAGFPGILNEPGDYSDQQLRDLGVNTCAIHEDMMVGGLDVDVEAVMPDGSRKDIIKDGKILI